MDASEISKTRIFDENSLTPKIPYSRLTGKNSPILLDRNKSPWDIFSGFPKLYDNSAYARESEAPIPVKNSNLKARANASINARKIWFLYLLPSNFSNILSKAFKSEFLLICPLF